MLKHKIQKALICFPLLAVLMVSGCIVSVPSPFRPSPGPQKAPQISDLAQAFDVVCRNYRLGPDDRVGLLFQAEWTVPTGSFKLDTLDELEVKFILDPQLNEKVIIRPDGMITLQGVGELKAAGLTPAELSKKIEDRYVDAEIFTRDETRSALKNYALVTVHVINFYQKIQKLLAAVTSLASGGYSQTIINPDGTLDAPLLSERILASGYTISEVESTLNRVYRAGPLKHVVVSVALKEARSRKVYVMGEVKTPGAYQISQPVTAMHAIAMAGGELPRSADMTSVILISKDINGKPIGRRLDLKKMLDVGDMGSAILVKPYDVLYVPKTYIEDVNIFVNQYLRVIADIKIFGDQMKTNTAD